MERNPWHDPGALLWRRSDEAVAAYLAERRSAFAELSDDPDRERARRCAREEHPGQGYFMDVQRSRYMARCEGAVRAEERCARRLADALDALEASPEVPEDRERPMRVHQPDEAAP